MPRKTANQSVATRITRVADTAVGSGTWQTVSKSTIVASLPPRPPGMKLTAPASIANA